MVTRTVQSDNNKTYHSHRGYTLVEILVVMLISFIVLGGVYRAITRENIELDQEEIIIDMQLNARAALDIIAADIRKAGFLGCAGNLAADTTGNSGMTDPLQTFTDQGVINTDLPIIDALKAAGGVNYIGAPLAYVNDASGHVTYQQNTDVITVRYLTGDEQLQTAMAAATTQIFLNTNDFSQGDILYITDCEFYSIFQKTDGDSTLSLEHVTGALVPGNSSADLGLVYGLNARVYNLVINTYFVQNNSFAISQNNTNTDIVTNIEDLQFQYKWDANGNNDLADDNWINDPVAAGIDASAIGEIRMYILAISDEVFSYTNDNTYDYPNSPYCSAAGAATFTCRGTTPPNDNFYRYLASAVVTLRNSGL